MQCETRKRSEATSRISTSRRDARPQNSFVAHSLGVGVKVLCANKNAFVGGSAKNVTNRLDADGFPRIIVLMLHERTREA